MTTLANKPKRLMATLHRALDSAVDAEVEFAQCGEVDIEVEGDALRSYYSGNDCFIGCGWTAVVVKAKRVRRALLLTLRVNNGL